MILEKKKNSNHEIVFFRGLYSSEFFICVPWSSHNVLNLTPFSVKRRACCIVPFVNFF